MHDRVIDSEQRWHAIGGVSAALLLVVQMYREDDVNGEEIIRIISAREANQRERRIYIQQAAQQAAAGDLGPYSQASGSAKPIPSKTPDFSRYVFTKDYTFGPFARPASSQTHERAASARPDSNETLIPVKRSFH
jgi:hypothetical protein